MARTPSAPLPTIAAPKDADVPATHVRNVEPNPFLDYFPKNDGKAHVWTFPGKTETDTKALNRIVSLIRKAGAEKGVTNRVTVSEPDGKGNVTVTAWSVEKITRKPKSK